MPSDNINSSKQNGFNPAEVVQNSDKRGLAVRLRCAQNRDEKKEGAIKRATENLAECMFAGLQGLESCLTVTKNATVGQSFRLSNFFKSMKDIADANVKFSNGKLF